MEGVKVSEQKKAKQYEQISLCLLIQSPELGYFQFLTLDQFFSFLPYLIRTILDGVRLPLRFSRRAR